MTIEQRLEKLERTVRRYQLAFGVLGLTLLATITVSCSQQAPVAQKKEAIPEIIVARSFGVLAKNGKAVLMLTAAERESGVTVGLIAGNTDKGGHLYTLSAGDQLGGMITVGDGSAYKKEPKPYIPRTIVLDGGSPDAKIKAGLTIRSEETKKRMVRLGIDEKKQGRLLVFDKTGKAGWTFPPGVRETTEKKPDDDSSSTE